MVADVAEEDDVVRLKDAAVQRFGRVDVWVHTAAVVAYGRFEDVPSEVFRRVVDTDVHGTVHVARAALEQFRQQGHGTLVLTGSLLGEIATPYMSSYVTSKWAVRGLARVLAVEARRDAGRPRLRRVTGRRGHAGLPPGGELRRPRRTPAAAGRLAGEGGARRSCAASSTTGRGGRWDRRTWWPAPGSPLLPRVFDLLVLPLMRAGGLSRRAGRAA